MFACHNAFAKALLVCALSFICVLRKTLMNKFAIIFRPHIFMLCKTFPSGRGNHE